MFILTNIPYKKENLFMVWIFSITLTKEVDFNQVSPSYEVAMEISKGKEKAMVLIFGCKVPLQWQKWIDQPTS